MNRLTENPKKRCSLYRYFVLFISVCTASNVFAQQNIPQRISEVLISKNKEECKALIQQLEESDISKMPDSTLCEYYYLAGWYSMENKDTEGQIKHLVKAKEICETKLGIQNNVYLYFEILKALGEACEESNQHEEALLWYEEGLIKGLPYFALNDETLQTYFKEMRNNTASIYESMGHIGIAEYLRDKKRIENINSFDYACDLLDKALHLYTVHKYEESLNLLDEAKGIFKRHGKEGEEMMQPLYRQYLICYARMGDRKRIDALLRRKANIMFYRDNDSYLVHDMYEVISIFLLDHYDIKAAEHYYNKMIKEVDSQSPNDIHTTNIIGANINHFKEIYAQIDSLEKAKISASLFSYEWGISSLLQSNLFIRIQRYDDANKLCEQIYTMSSALKDDPQNLHWFVLMNLADYQNLNNNYHKEELYLNEQQAWLNSKKISLDAEERGWLYNKLGIVYLNQKRYAECKDMLAKAEKILFPIYGQQSQEYATILHNKGRLAQLEGRLDEAKRLLEESSQIQMNQSGKVMDKTSQYLDEVKHAINVRL